MAEQAQRMQADLIRFQREQGLARLQQDITSQGSGIYLPARPGSIQQQIGMAAASIDRAATAAPFF